MKIRFLILNPEDYNLSNDYIFASNPWGVYFYKTYESMNYVTALAQCESDGAFLAYPRSEAENDFILSLIPSTDIWIGISDVDEEGTVVASDGQDIVFTKWYSPEQPASTNNRPDAALIRGASRWAQNLPGYWNWQLATNAHEFVCYYRIS